jgi:DMSO reductase anchor subunit
LLGLDLFAGGSHWIPLLAALALAGMSLGTASLHLGRPAYAWRALKGLRRSWLSREVLTLSIFAAFAGAYAGSVLLHLPGRLPAGVLAVLFGCAGIFCSARIYIVPARPAWFSPYTIAEFFSTALLLGPLFVRTLDQAGADSWQPQLWLTRAAVAGGAAQFLTQILKFFWVSRSEQFELRATAVLLSGRLKNEFLSRLGLLIVAGMLLPLTATSRSTAAVALVLALIGECLGRWLFFVSVVPKSIATSFTRSGRAA